ncbi:MAG TPA: glycosyltransferase family 39 protein [Planctomycetota bacterium]|nr:glycosyltransferase family 39 protein [Planctomycetota bacterium]
MVFAIRRAGLTVTLSAARYEVFAAVAAAVAFASVIAGFVLARRALWGTDRQGERNSPWRVAVALGVLVICAVPTYMLIGWASGRLHYFAYYDSRWYRQMFFRELGLVTTARLFWLAGGLALAACALARPWKGRAISKLLDGVQRMPRPVLVLAASALVAGLALGVSLGMLRGEAHYNDAQGYYFQAKTFAAGRLWSPLPGGQEFFDPRVGPARTGVVFCFLGDRWFFVAPPVAALIYAAGFLMGMPWLMAPLMGGAVVAATYSLAREVLCPRAALLAMALTALSGWLVFNAAEYLSHVPCLLLMLLFMTAALRTIRCGSWGWGAAAGLLLGLGALARPGTALGLCLPFAAVWVAWLIRRPRQAWMPAIAFAVALAVPLAGLLAYNAATTGNPLLSGYQVVLRNHKLGADPILVPGWRWRPVVGVANFLEMAFRFDAATYHWPIPALGALVGLVLFAGARRQEGRASPLLLGAAGLTLALVYTRWSNVSIGMSGPRYVFEALPLAAILAAAGLAALHDRLIARGFPPDRVRATLTLALAGCFLYGTAVTLVRELPQYRNLHGVDLRVFDTVEAQAERPAIVFLPVPHTTAGSSRLVAAVARNDPAIAGPILYVRDLGEQNHRLIAARPGRHLYRWDEASFSLVPLGPDGVSAAAPTGRP